MHKKTQLWTWVVLSLLVLGFMASKPVGRLIRQARETLRTERYLRVENGSLLYSRQSFGRAPEVKVLKKIKSSALTARFTGKEIEINFNGKEFRRASLTQTMIVSSLNRALYFTELETLPPDSKGRAMAGFRLWQWTESGGFESMTPSGISSGSPRLSVDEKSLLVQEYGMGVPDGLRIYDLKTKQSKFIPFGKQTANTDALVDSDTFLVATMEPNGNGEPLRRIYKTQLASGKSERLLPGRDIERAVAFDGAIWALIKAGESYEVCRLSPELDDVDEAIKVN
ncbi:MAG: hypothetical protein WCI55_06910 [Armatimonadota bacterium]